MAIHVTFDLGICGSETFAFPGTTKIFWEVLLQDTEASYFTKAPELAPHAAS